MNTYRKIILLSLFCLATLSLVYASGSSIKGTITAKESGQPIEKVKITIISQKNQTLKYELETDTKGTYYKAGLTNGMFTIVLEKEGYVPAQSSIRLGVDQSFEFSTQLEPLQVKTSEQSNTLLQEAQKLLNSGKYDDAITKLDQLIEKNPEYFILYFNRAVAYERKDDKTKALLDYEKSLQLKPDFLLSLAAAGKIYAKNSAFEKAAALYQKAFTLGITDTAALYNYGACLVNLGNNEEAKTVFEKLISLDANYADAFYQLGIIYLGLNNNTKAKEFLNQFITMDPENPNVPTAKEIIGSLN